MWINEKGARGMSDDTQEVTYGWLARGVVLLQVVHLVLLLFKGRAQYSLVGVSDV
jgi:hypothetical protein